MLHLSHISEHNGIINDIKKYTRLSVNNRVMSLTTSKINAFLLYKDNINNPAVLNIFWPGFKIHTHCAKEATVRTF